MPAAVVALAMAGSGLAAGQARAADSVARVPVRLAGTTMSVSGQLAGIAVRSSASAASLSRADYAGVSLSVPAQMVTIYVTKAPTASLARVAEAGSAFGHVRFKVVRYTFARLTAGQSRLNSDVRELRRDGIKITDWGPDPVTNSLHVGLIHPTAAAEKAIRAAVGIPVTFTAESSYPTLAATRIDDTAGYNGGDFMADGSSGCTTGPPVINPTNDHQYFLSVAHCFDYATGDVEYNDDILDSRGCGFSGCAYLGTSSHVQSSTGYDDALMSGATYSDLDWQNSTPYNPPGTLNGYTNPQETHSTSVVGELVCPSGAYEGMVCSTTVLFAKETVNIGGDLYNIDRAQNTSAIPVGGGDSGGPVFSTPPGHLNVEGVIEARGDAIACKTYTFRGADCSHTIYYFDFAAQAAVWGVVLKTS
ncbi:MAG: hypothetical protein ABSA02_34955 [Trebonia sp.]